MLDGAVANDNNDLHHKGRAVYAIELRLEYARTRCKSAAMKTNTKITAKQKLQVAMLLLMFLSMMILGLIKLFLLIELWTK